MRRATTRQCSGIPGRSRLLLASLLLLPLLAAVATTTAAATGPGGDLGPIAGWIEDLTKESGETEKQAKRARDWIESSPGPLDQPARSNVESALDRIELIIVDLLDANVYPSLFPAGAGEVDESVQPETLPEFAEAVEMLAAEAHDALVNAPDGEPDDELVGTCLKTIEALLPEYRILAGL